MTVAKHESIFSTGLTHQVEHKHRQCLRVHVLVLTWEAEQTGFGGGMWSRLLLQSFAAEVRTPADVREGKEETPRTPSAYAPHTAGAPEHKQEDTNSEVTHRLKLRGRTTPGRPEGVDMNLGYF